jgi:dephospho-CoA kinase
MGSGKSTVAAEFIRRGGRLISGDQLGHEALRQPEVRDEVVRRWGREVLDPDGQVSRPKVAARVFANDAERRALEALVFPWIERRFQEEIARANADPDVAFIVLDAAIMLEAGWNNVCDSLVYIHAPRVLRLRRLAEQRGWNAKEVEARERAQLPLTVKVSRADFAIDNSGPPEQVAPQVEALLRRLGEFRYRPKKEEIR